MRKTWMCDFQKLSFSLTIGFTHVFAQFTLPDPFNQSTPPTSVLTETCGDSFSKFAFVPLSAKENHEVGRLVDFDGGPGWGPFMIMSGNEKGLFKMDPEGTLRVAYQFFITDAGEYPLRLASVNGDLLCTVLINVRVAENASVFDASGGNSQPIDNSLLVQPESIATTTTPLTTRHMTFTTRLMASPTTTSVQQRVFSLTSPTALATLTPPTVLANIVTINNTRDLFADDFDFERRNGTKRQGFIVNPGVSNPALGTFPFGPMCADPFLTVAVPADTPPNTLITKVTATHQINTPIVYSIPDVVFDRFRVDAINGQVYTGPEPLSQRNRLFRQGTVVPQTRSALEFRVRASLATGMYCETVVRVNVVPTTFQTSPPISPFPAGGRNPPFFLSQNFHFVVTVCQPGNFIGRIEAQDRDPGDRLQYLIDNPSSEVLIDSSTAALRIGNIPPQQVNRQIVVRAIDSTGLSATTVVGVSFRCGSNPVSAGRLQFTQASYRFFPPNCAVGSIVGIVTLLGSPVGVFLQTDAPQEFAVEPSGLIRIVGFVGINQNIQRTFTVTASDQVGNRAQAAVTVESRCGPVDPFDLDLVDRSPQSQNQFRPPARNPGGFGPNEQIGRNPDVFGGSTAFYSRPPESFNGDPARFNQFRPEPIYFGSNMNRDALMAPNPLGFDPNRFINFPPNMSPQSTSSGAFPNFGPPPNGFFPPQTVNRLLESGNRGDDSLRPAVLDDRFSPQRATVSTNFMPGSGQFDVILKLPFPNATKNPDGRILDQAKELTSFQFNENSGRQEEFSSLSKDFGGTSGQAESLPEEPNPFKSFQQKQLFTIGRPPLRGQNQIFMNQMDLPTERNPGINIFSDGNMPPLPFMINSQPSPFGDTGPFFFPPNPPQISPPPRNLFNTDMVNYFPVLGMHTGIQGGPQDFPSRQNVDTGNFPQHGQPGHRQLFFDGIANGHFILNGALQRGFSDFILPGQRQTIMNGAPNGNPFTELTVQLPQLPGQTPPVFVTPLCAPPNTNFLGRVKAIDPDDVDRVTYFIWSTGGTDLFDVNAVTGEIRSRIALLVGTYNVDVAARDLSGRTAIMRLEISITPACRQPRVGQMTDFSETAPSRLGVLPSMNDGPRFTQPVYRFLGPPNAGPQTMIGQVQAFGDGSGISYSLSPPGEFEIDSQGRMFMLSSVEGPRNLQVTATDGRGRFTSTTVTIFGPSRPGASNPAPFCLNDEVPTKSKSMASTNFPVVKHFGIIRQQSKTGLTIHGPTVITVDAPYDGTLPASLRTGTILGEYAVSGGSGIYRWFTEHDNTFEMMGESTGVLQTKTTISPGAYEYTASVKDNAGKLASINVRVIVRNPDFAENLAHSAEPNGPRNLQERHSNSLPDSEPAR